MTKEKTSFEKCKEWVEDTPLSYSVIEREGHYKIHIGDDIVFHFEEDGTFFYREVTNMHYFNDIND